MSVIALHKTQPSEDVVATLRRIADEIEGDRDNPVMTAVLCLGSISAERPGEGNDVWHEAWWRTYGFGPRHDTFSTRGLMATCMRNWEPE